MQNSPQVEKIQSFLSRLPQPEQDAMESPDPNAPQVVFESPLQLTQAQEESLVSHALKRFEDMEGQLGRTEIKESTWYRNDVQQTKTAARTFMGKRQLYENVYNLQLEWREYAYGEDSIFCDSNLTLPLSRRVTQQQAARANGYFFGSDPWFNTSPVGVEDKALSEEVERFSRYKLKKGKAKKFLKQAVRGAFIRGEGIVKTVHKNDVSYYKSFAEVAVDQDGKPIVAKDGDFIYRTSSWTMGIVKDDLGQEVEELILKRDMRTVHPLGGGDLTYETKHVRRSMTKYRGAEATHCYFKDVLIPEDSADVQDADCMVHLVDRPAVEFAQMYMERVDQSGEFGSELPRVVDFLDSASPADGMEPIAFADQPREQLGDDTIENVRSNTRDEPVIRTGEFYLWFDADEDGYQENIMLVVDLDRKLPIYYDYVENITPDGLRPFHVFRVNPVENRWYGTGTMEVMWPLQESLDLMWNRLNFSQSRAGNVYFWNPDNVEEGDHEENLEFNGGDTFTLKYGKEAKDALEVVPIYDVKFDKLDRMQEIITQFGVNLSAVANANDAGMAGLDTQQRATGIVNIEKSGQEMFGDFINDLEDGLESAVKALVMLELAFMDESEVYEFFDGEDRAIRSLDKTRVNDLDVDVTIDLNRYQGERLIEQLGQAINTGIQYYGLMPEVQERLTNLFRDVLKKLGVKNAEAIIEPLIMGMGFDEPLPGDEEAMMDNADQGPIADIAPGVQPPVAGVDVLAASEAGVPTDKEAEPSLPPDMV